MFEPGLFKSAGTTGFPLEQYSVTRNPRQALQSDVHTQSCLFGTELQPPKVRESQLPTCLVLSSWVEPASATGIHPSTLCLTRLTIEIETSSTHPFSAA